VWFEEISIPTPRRVVGVFLEIPWWRGVSKARIFKGKP